MIRPAMVSQKMVSQTMNSSSSLLDVSELSWCADGKTILSEISFQIQNGQFVGLLGPNGAGKSSLMRCLYRVNEPTSGAVSFKGQNIWQYSAKQNAQNIAVILQEHNGHMGLTVKDVVALGLTPHKKLFERDTSTDIAVIQQVMQDVDLIDMQHSLFTHLSGGEKQRVMLARAIVQSPQLLIMDEPTNHLDVHYQVDMLQKVRQLNKTVLASFHDLNLAAAYCDWLLVLDKGRLVATGTPEQVLTEDLIGRIFKTCAVVDKHPIHNHPRISYAYHSE